MRTFVDTDVLIYAHDVTERPKQQEARAVLEELWRSGGGALSTQVLQEFYNGVTRKIPVPLTPVEARGVVADYAQWPLVTLDLDLIVGASELEEKLSLSFWDALIVVAAREVGADTLLSEDLQHGRLIGEVRIENPFL
ncbi:MAG: PIN domain-containing protein [Actinomycetota bacterium]